ncbi:hypothetical protein [Ligilactobacillus agilis]|uniref:Type II toxin-antitoxin system antitoxin, RelB/DinJ family n=1 Tax=Ligilactobacillus agilis TaxID=1601 RepID=A0A9Q9MP23_9LACO|nr:hypothetical protein [Ligilactobacillus agilis]UXC62956.1 hypothetical protein N4562_07740 [Ligilactobacillus agilis]UXC64955.1 hypothetical protein N4597_07735 [Ligilactobacillus agilis]GET16316.1 hypothetical protein NB11A_06070 [Ligilactobacillus agilis]
MYRSTVAIQLDERVVLAAEWELKKHGLDVDVALNLFYRQIARTGIIPLFWGLTEQQKRALYLDKYKEDAIVDWLNKNRKNKSNDCYYFDEYDDDF